MRSGRHSSIGDIFLQLIHGEEWRTADYDHQVEGYDTMIEPTTAMSFADFDVLHILFLRLLALSAPPSRPGRLHFSLARRL